MPKDKKKPRSLLVSMAAGTVCAAVAGGLGYLNFPDAAGMAVGFAIIGLFAGAWFGPRAIGALVTVL